jgi:hypothetical protein
MGAGKAAAFTVIVPKYPGGSAVEKETIPSIQPISVPVPEEVLKVEPS